MNQTYDLTVGDTKKKIISFFIPLFFSNMLQQFYSIADTTIVGKGIDDNALAAVGNMASISFLIIGFCIGLTSGFSVLISQFYGAKDYKKLRNYLSASLLLTIFLSLMMTTASLLYLKDILVLMQTKEVIIGDSLAYGFIMFGGLSITMFYNFTSSILRALGDSKTPFITIVISTILNIVLDIVFIFVFKWGVAGAAIATVFSQFVSTALCYLKLRKITFIHLSLKDFDISLKTFFELLRNGIPMAIMNSITAVGCMVVQYFVNGLGVAYTTAFSACSKFINLFMQPACSAGNTMSSFTSQNYGAQKYDRIKEGLKICLTIALISYLLLGSIMFLFPSALARIMINGSRPVSLAVLYFKRCGIMLWAVDFLFIFRSGTQGMGKPFIPMLSGVLEMIMRVVVIMNFLPVYGFKITAYSEIAAWVGALLLNIFAFIYSYNKLAKKDVILAVN